MDARIRAALERRKSAAAGKHHDSRTRRLRDRAARRRQSIKESKDD